MIQQSPSLENPERNIVVTKYDLLLDKKNIVITTDENIDKKSPDYFNSKITSICYDDGDNKIKLNISGKGREEDIEVFKNNEKIHFSDKINKNILSMTGTFPHHEMFLLEDLLSTKDHFKKEVFPYIEVNDNKNKYGQPTSQQELSDMIDFRLNRLPNTNELIIPVLSNKDHWFMFSCKIDHESKNIKLTITNTIHEAKAKGNLEDIINGYVDTLELIHDGGIKKSKFLSSYTIERADFCQSLQYGNMGCGITTSLNEQSLLNGEMSVEKLRFTPDSFRTNEETLQFDAFHDGKKYSLTGEKARLAKSFCEVMGDSKIPINLIKNSNYSQEDAENDIISFFSGEDVDLIEVKDLSLPKLKEDKSQRGFLALESIRRVDLAFKSLEMEQKKNALHDELRMVTYQNYV